MENRDEKSPPTDQQTDLSKARNEQQPIEHQPTGQDDDGNAGPSDTIAEQRSDIEGGTTTGKASDIEGSSTFVGTQGASDASSELIEDEDTEDDRGDGE